MEKNWICIIGGRAFLLGIFLASTGDELFDKFYTRYCLSGDIFFDILCSQYLPEEKGKKALFAFAFHPSPVSLGIIYGIFDV